MVTVIVHASVGAVVTVGKISVWNRKQSVVAAMVVIKTPVVRTQILHVVRRTATNIVQTMCTAEMNVVTQIVDSRLGLWLPDISTMTPLVLWIRSSVSFLQSHFHQMVAWLPQELRQRHQGIRYAELTVYLQNEAGEDIYTASRLTFSPDRKCLASSDRCCDAVTSGTWNWGVDSENYCWRSTAISPSLGGIPLCGSGY